MQVLVEQFQKLCRAGWVVTKEEVERDIWRLMGGSYEDFLAK